MCLGGLEVSAVQIYKPILITDMGGIENTYRSIFVGVESTPLKLVVFFRNNFLDYI